MEPAEPGVTLIVTVNEAPGASVAAVQVTVLAACPQLSAFAVNVTRLMTSDPGIASVMVMPLAGELPVFVMVML
jgi:hypothetical protein